MVLAAGVQAMAANSVDSPLPSTPSMPLLEAKGSQGWVLGLAVPGLTVPWTHSIYLWLATAISIGVHEVSACTTRPEGGCPDRLRCDSLGRSHRKLACCRYSRTPLPLSCQHCPMRRSSEVVCREPPSLSGCCLCVLLQAGHALAAASEGVGVQHVAAFTLLLLPGAYVALDTGTLTVLGPWRTLRVRLSCDMPRAPSCCLKRTARLCTHAVGLACVPGARC